MISTVRVGDLSFDVRVGGPTGGRPVLLLHGFPQHGGMWDAVSERLHGAGLRTYAPDQRGYSPGASPDDPEAYRMSELVSDVLGLADALGLSTVDLVGHDWGAAVAWQVAARHPDRLRSLTAVGIGHPLAYRAALKSSLEQQKRSAYLLLFRQKPGRPERVLLADGGRRLRAVFAGSGLDEAGIARYADPLVTQPERLTTALHWYRAMGRRDQEGLTAVTVPTTYVWGDEDLAQGRKAAEQTREHVTAPYRFIPLEGRSHWLPDEVPDIVADAILERVRAS
ncbi:MAG TPA: alpha/beta hydrolase [Mycobacteriales bacterium]|jgi:pimeloyl-ACP methyl ester carboxylesterase